MTTDLRTASEQECMDYIVECQGWRKTTPSEQGDTGWVRGVEVPEGLRITGISVLHPLASIDTADIPLPPGWKLLDLSDNRSDGGSPRYPWSCRMVDKNKYHDTAIFAWGDTERLARWRAAALAWERWAGDKKETT